MISQLFDQIWSVRGMVSPEIITASMHNGGYGSVAWLGDRIPNQLLRWNPTDGQALRGHLRFSDALACWRTLDP